MSRPVHYRIHGGTPECAAISGEWGERDAAKEAGKPLPPVPRMHTDIRRVTCRGCLLLFSRWVTQALDRTWGDS